MGLVDETSTGNSWLERQQRGSCVPDLLLGSLHGDLILAWQIGTETRALEPS